MVTFASLWTFVVSNKEHVTLAIAVLGAGLGVLNLCRDIRKTERQERVRLEVIPKLGLMLPVGMATLNSGDVPNDPSAFLVVEVINHSYFPVFIERLYIRTDSHPGRECIVFQASVNPNRDWPLKLEKHESVTLYNQHLTVGELVNIGARGAYVKTSTNLRFDGTSPAFEGLYAKYRELPHTQVGTVDWNAADGMERGS